MIDPLALSLVISALVLLFIQGVSLTWTALLARNLRGRDGGELARLLLIMAVAILVAQVLSVARAVLINAAPIVSIELRVGLFLAEEIVLVVASVVVMLRARRLYRPDAGPDTAVPDASP